MWESTETPHRDSDREFTTVLTQWSNTRVPGEDEKKMAALLKEG